MRGRLSPAPGWVALWGPSLVCGCRAAERFGDRGRDSSCPGDRAGGCRNRRRRNRPVTPQRDGFRPESPAPRTAPANGPPTSPTPGPAARTGGSRWCLWGAHSRCRRDTAPTRPTHPQGAGRRPPRAPTAKGGLPGPEGHTSRAAAPTSGPQQVPDPLHGPAARGPPRPCPRRRVPPLSLPTGRSLSPAPAAHTGSPPPRSRTAIPPAPESQNPSHAIPQPTTSYSTSPPGPRATSRTSEPFSPAAPRTHRTPYSRNIARRSPVHVSRAK